MVKRGVEIYKNINWSSNVQILWKPFGDSGGSVVEWTKTELISALVL